MAGYWISNDSQNCYYLYIEIDKSGNGTYSNLDGKKGCGQKMNGKARYTNHSLYFGITKLEFINKPELSYANDSMSFKPHQIPNSRILAKMTVKLSVLYGDPPYTFYKLVDY